MAETIRMGRNGLRSTIAVGALAVVAMVVVGAQMSRATDEQIHACVSAAGQLRIVDDPSKCRANEEVLSWNIQGIQGEQGEQGDQGNPGNDATAPGGMVAFFASTTCPSGWTEYAGARGRALVGMPSGGTLNGIVGGAMGNLVSPQHSHTVSGTTGTGFHGHPNTTGAFGSGLSVEPGGLVGDNHSVPGFGHFHGTNGGGEHVHGVAPTAASAAHLPYLQLLACSKS